MTMNMNSYRLLRYQTGAQSAARSAGGNPPEPSLSTPAQNGAELKQLQQELALVQQECTTLMDALSTTPASAKPAPAVKPAPAPKPAANQPPKPAPKPAAKPAANTAPKPAAATYTVQSGDTLSGIAQRALGAASRWTDIYNLNRNQIANPNVIHPGQVLKLPNGSKPVPAPSPSPSRASAPAPASAPGGTVGQWIQEATKVLEQNGVPASKIDPGAIAIIIQHESSGNPRAINLTDSNAAAGHPSKGLMQTIDPTFNAYAAPGHKDIWNPVDNIVAGVRYAISRYGSLSNVPGVKAVRAGRSYVGY